MLLISRVIIETWLYEVEDCKEYCKHGKYLEEKIYTKGDNELYGFSCSVCICDRCAARLDLVV